MGVARHRHGRQRCATANEEAGGRGDEECERTRRRIGMFGAADETQRKKVWHVPSETRTRLKRRPQGQPTILRRGHLVVRWKRPLLHCARFANFGSTRAESRGERRAPAPQSRQPKPAKADVADVHIHVRVVPGHAPQGVPSGDRRAARAAIHTKIAALDAPDFAFGAGAARRRR